MTEDNIKKIHEAMEAHNISDDKRFTELFDGIRKLELSINGDGKEDKGMAMEMREIHEFIIGAKISAKVLKWIFGAVVVVGTFLTALNQIKRFFSMK